MVDPKMENTRVATPDARRNTTDKTGAIRFDFLFSYWIIIWFLVFYFIPVNTTGAISKWIRSNMNPALAFRIAVAENIIVLGWLVIQSLEIWTFVKYMVMMTTLKIIPLYLLRKEKIHWVHDSLVFVLFFGLYNAYLWWNDTNIYEIYERTFVSIKEGKNQTPMFMFLQQWFHIQ